jgi:hypothetical protein
MDDRTMAKPKSPNRNRTSPTVEQARRDALTLRASGRSYQAIADHLGIVKSYAYALVKEGLADIPREAAQELYDLTCDMLDVYIAQAHAGVVQRFPLRDKAGHAVLNDAGQAIMVPHDPNTQLAFINTAARLALERAKFGGAGAPTKAEVTHTGGVTVIGSSMPRYMVPAKDDEDFARQVAATERCGGHPQAGAGSTTAT